MLHQNEKATRNTPTMLPLKYSRGFEWFLAVFNLKVVLFVIVWKTIGLAWLPAPVQDAFSGIISPTSRWYPRHDRNEAEYNVFYLVTYGIFGLAAQLSSIRLVSNEHSKLPKAIFCAFHFFIAIYHCLFASRVVSGKLIMMENGTFPPWMTYGALLIYLAEVFVAMEFATKPYNKTCKISLDLASFFNISPFPISLFLFLIGLGTDTMAYVVTISFFIVGPTVVLFSEIMRIIRGYRESLEDTKKAS